MTQPTALEAQALYRRCDPAEFSFETTAELVDLAEAIGQARAMEAVRFGIAIRDDGYNLYALGNPGTGRHTALRQLLERRARDEPLPDDWCYVNNFAAPHRPHALSLPAGQGAQLRQDVDGLIENLRGAIPVAFEAEDYRTRKQAIEEELKERQAQALAAIHDQAEQQDVALLRTPVGFAFAPQKKGEVVSPEDFEKLPEDEQKRIQETIARLQQQLRATLHQAPQWERETHERIKELNREVGLFAVGHLLDELHAKYAALPPVLAYLDSLRQAVLENLDDFRRGDESESSGAAEWSAGAAPGNPSSFRRYRVNLIVEHGSAGGAPVVYEDNPGYQRLVGRVEHLAQMGALVTDFTLIKPGALHRANGGYLLLDAHKALLQPYAWDGLKRALRAGEIRIESLGQMLSLVSTVSLEPQPIPLDVKVVLLGDRLLYYLLAAYDPDFSDLFKVAADFEDELRRDPEHHLLYARLIGTLARQHQLRPFDRGGCARVIEHSSRLVGDADKLSAHMRSITDLLREANYWAGEAGREQVGADDVQHALDAQVRRADRLRQHLQEQTRRGILMIDTAGERVGQVNGLSVIDLPNFAFGHPSRISASVRLGKGEVLDIQREVELGGPIHSKGVLILTGFLAARYGATLPLAFSASLVFEQTYGEVEGDSASSAELYALLSALAEAPIRQGLAVTGSVNQYGEVQAIGGVNEKIEGFFDVCQAHGLTGDQGVLIPAANRPHLMLRRDVVDAAAAGRFHIYPVRYADEGMELLTGMPTGVRDASGAYPPDSINHRVEARLALMAMSLRAFSGGRDDEGDGP